MRYFLPSLPVIRYQVILSPSESLSSRFIGLGIKRKGENRTIAQWHHFTTTTRMFQFVFFLCKLSLSFIKPLWDWQILIRNQKRDKQLTTTYLIAAEPPKIYLFLVKLVVYYQSAFWLVELWLGCMLKPTSSEKRLLWKPKQWRLNRVLLAKVVLSRYFWPTSWILLKQLFLLLSWPLSQ